MKIYCLEMQKKGFDKLSLKEIAKMVGWIEPPHTDNGTWDVTLADGGIFECKDQSTAEILASIEEVKAILMSKQS